jgi:hypothetical protein
LAVRQRKTIKKIIPFSFGPKKVNFHLVNIHLPKDFSFYLIVFFGLSMSSTPNKKLENEKSTNKRAKIEVNNETVEV